MLPAREVYKAEIPMSTNEEERLKEVLLYRTVDEDMAVSLDEICRLVQSLFHVSIALVTLVGAGEQTYLAKCGTDLNGATGDDAFCNYAILDDDVLVIGDTANDPRFCDNPNVTGGLKVRFYAGAPLVIRPGIRLGTLCLIDTVPRDFSAEEAAQLQTMARMVVNEMRRWRVMIDLQREQDLQRQTARLAKVGSWVLDLSAGALTWSDETFRIFDVDQNVAPTPELVEGLWRSGGRVGFERAAAAMQKIMTNGTPFDIELPIVTARGNARWIRCAAEAELRQGKVARITGSMQDVTAEHAHAIEIERLAYRDALTDLPNRALFLEMLGGALQQANRNDQIALLLFDMDHFKNVNDALGHEVGDRLVNEVATLLSSSFGPEAFTARIGGDEFAVVIACADANRLTAEARQVIQRHDEIRRAERLPVTLSAGLALYPDHAPTSDYLLRMADTALFQAKEQGRNRLVVFEQKMQDDIERQLALLQDVRRGIAASEFVLFYQPIVAIQGREEVQGFEALMRWRHPEKGLLSPGSFAAAFDDPKLSHALGEVALDSAMTQMRAWRDEKVPFGRVAVNLSSAQFQMDDLAAHVAKKLKRFRVAPRQLTLEVTENVYLGWNGQLVSDTIRALHDQGILIALDDFGTGYASLTSVNHFPIDRLKIDQSFVRELSDPAVVAAVLALGRSKGIKVIAEGVETVDQLNTLRAMGCDKVQGYYYSKPMPAEAVPQFLHRFAGGMAKDVAAA